MSDIQVTPELVNEKLTALHGKQAEMFAKQAELDTAIRQNRELADVLKASIDDLKAKSADKAEIQALDANLKTVQSVVSQMEIERKRPGFGGGKAKQEWQSIGAALLEKGASAASKQAAKGDKIQQTVRLDDDLGDYVRQALWGGRTDETGGSLAHFQPETVQPGVIRAPDAPSSVLAVLGVRSIGDAVLKYNRRTKKISVLTVAAAATSSGAGPHTFTCVGSRDAWINMGATTNGAARKLIVRHVNGTEETGFTYTTLAAVSADAAENKAGIFTIGVTGTLAANFAIGDVLYLADQTDGTIPAKAIPTGVKAGQLMPFGKIITALVTRYGVKLPVLHKIAGEIVRHEPSFQNELDTDFAQTLRETLAQQVWQGAGSGAADQHSLLGIANVSGIQTQDAVGGETALDTILRGITKIRTQGFKGAISCFVHPTAYGAMKRLKDLDENYLVWPQLDCTFYEDVFMSETDTDIAYLVADGAYEIYEVANGSEFAMSNSDGEDFGKDLVTLRWLGTWIVKDAQPLGICKLNFTP